MNDLVPRADPTAPEPPHHIVEVETEEEAELLRQFAKGLVVGVRFGHLIDWCMRQLPALVGAALAGLWLWHAMARKQ
jgi:F0F1-type ATP synthase assembly protein I